MVTNPYLQTLHGFLHQAEALLAYTPAQDLTAIHAQTLVIAGKHDTLIPPYLSERLVAGIPNSAFATFSGAHSGFVELPDEYNRAFLEFLGADQPVQQRA